jgi:hypothetical protein
MLLLTVEEQAFLAIISLLPYHVFHAILHLCLMDSVSPNSSSSKISNSSFSSLRLFESYTTIMDSETTSASSMGFVYG